MSRFTLELTLRDQLGQPLHIAIDLAPDTLRISPRTVEEAKIGVLGSMTAAVELMQVRQMRKDLFIEAARRLGTLLAERMEDAEGWHDESRVEAARAQLGGTWRD